MQIITLIEFILLAIVIIYIIESYSAKDVQIHVKSTVFITWMVAIGMIMILPFDIYLTRLAVIKDINLEENEGHQKLTTIYIFMYYLLFFLTWVIIPIQQGCIDSGYHRFEDRLKYSLKINGLFYLAIAILGLLFVIIVINLNLPGEHGLINFFLSLANCWGIFLIMVLLGYSLVAIPKAHWRTTDLELEMKYLQFRTQFLTEEQEMSMANLLEGVIELLDVEEKSRNTENEQEIMLYVFKGLELVSNEFVRNCRELLQTEENQKKFRSKQSYTVEDSVNIYLNVKYKYAEVRRSRCEWVSFKKRAFLMEDILANRNNEQKIIISNIRLPRSGYMARERDNLSWYWHTQWKCKVKYFYASFLTICSIFIIIDESSLFINQFDDFAIFGKLLRYLVWKDLSFFACQVIVLIPLCYMVYIVLYGFFRLRLTGFYGVYPHKNTDASSLLFTSINFSRVSAPLCFNILNILEIKDSAFNRAIGNINLVPVLGESFPKYFPLVMICLVIFNFFDLYDRIVNYFGWSSFQFSPDFNSKFIDQGKETLKIKREWELLELQRLQKSNLCIRESYNLENPNRTSLYMRLIEQKDSIYN